MFHRIKRFLIKKRKYKNQDIAPDEIFIDSQNLPNFDTDQFEGRIEKPISKTTLGGISLCIIFFSFLFIYKLWGLQIVKGTIFRTRSDNNSLRHSIIYADRGVIYDRNNIPLVWNSINPNSLDFSLRVYATSTGLSTILGYIKYPTKDSHGVYYQSTFEPKDGLERVYNVELSGKNGTKITETDVKSKIISESVIDPPQDGKNLNLSIDLKLQRQLHISLLDVANRAGYKGGAGIIMNVHTGEILSASGFPEYDSQIMTDGYQTSKINFWLNDKNHPFLNRVIDGLYTPGSIMKLFVAIGVLQEKIIDPNTKILSTGSISIPNPFFPDKPSVFLDWKAHGLVDLRRAIAVSSNVYFYEVGGGYKDQKGLGIDNIDKYARMFGFGTTTNINFFGEKGGTIPNPVWKSLNFKGENWRIGDTYNTAIGQYGFQVSPIQVVRAVSALANEGKLLVPTFIVGGGPKISNNISIDSNYYKIIKEGMRLGVTEGTSHVLNLPFVEVASKTGTAQLGVSKDEVNSWVIGFWPYKEPKYAYAVVMERGSKNNQFGATVVMQEFLNWVSIYASNYLN